MRTVEREKQNRIVMKASSSRPSARSWLAMDVDMARRNCKQMKKESDQMGPRDRASPHPDQGAAADDSLSTLRTATFSMIKEPWAHEKELMMAYVSWAVMAEIRTICTPKGPKSQAGGKSTKPKKRLSHTQMKTAIITAHVRMTVALRQWQTRCCQPRPAPVVDEEGAERVGEPVIDR